MIRDLAQIGIKDQIVTPTTTNITKPAGIYDGDITISGDADLVPSNIKHLANLFGVVGNYDTEASSPITAAGVLSGKIGFVNGEKVTGTAPNKIGSGTVIIPELIDQAIPAGVYGGASSDGKVLGIPQGSQGFSTAGNYYFTVPAGVHHLVVVVVGGGGGGGGVTTDGGGPGGGGQGGIWITAMLISPGAVFEVVVGAGGAAGLANAQGQSGGDSSFHDVTAYGGQGGMNSSGGGGSNGGQGGTGGGYGGDGSRGQPGSSAASGGSAGAGGGSVGLGRGGVGNYPGSAGRVTVMW